MRRENGDGGGLTTRRGDDSIQHIQETEFDTLRCLQRHLSNSYAGKIALYLFKEKRIDLTRLLLCIAFGGHKHTWQPRVCHRSCGHVSQNKPCVENIVAPTQSRRYIGDALLIGDTVETKDAVDVWEGCTVHGRWPLDPSFATEVDIVKQQLDKLDVVRLIFDSHLSGSSRPFLINGCFDECTLAAILRPQNQEFEGWCEAGMACLEA